MPDKVIVFFMVMSLITHVYCVGMIHLQDDLMKSVMEVLKKINEFFKCINKKA